MYAIGCFVNWVIGLYKTIIKKIMNFDDHNVVLMNRAKGDDLCMVLFNRHASIE